MSNDPTRRVRLQFGHPRGTAVTHDLFDFFGFFARKMGTLARLCWRLTKTDGQECPSYRPNQEPNFRSPFDPFDSFERKSTFTNRNAWPHDQSDKLSLMKLLGHYLAHKLAHPIFRDRSPAFKSRSAEISRISAIFNRLDSPQVAGNQALKQIRRSHRSSRTGTTHQPLGNSFNCGHRDWYSSCPGETAYGRA